MSQQPGGEADWEAEVPKFFEYEDLLLTSKKFAAPHMPTLSPNN
jgi:hypothetical protein